MTALQEIEPKLRTVRGYRHLRELRDAMRDLNYKENIVKVARGIVQFQLTMGLRQKTLIEKKSDV